MKKKNLKIPNQTSVWNNIACGWKSYRINSIKEAVNFIKNCKGKVLDIGCGSGRNFVKIPGNLYAIDFSKNQLKFAKDYASKNNIDVILKKAKAENLPFEDNFFDKIISIATIHCIESENKRNKALSEIFRVLKKGGTALITVWDKNQDKFKHENKEILLKWNINGKNYERYYYLYDREEIIKLLEKIGFKIIKVLDKNNCDLDNSNYTNRNIIIYIKK